MHPRVFRFEVYVLAAFLLPGYLWYSPASSAQTPGATLYEAPAVYLYNLAKFVRWTSGGDHESVTICVAGPTAKVEALRKVTADEGPGARTIEAHAVERTEQVAACDILFLDASTKEHADEWLAASAGKPVLTVSDLPDFLDRGGMIQLEMGEDRVRFSVDLRPVARSGLVLSSELLKVASSVRGATGDGGTP